MPCVAGVEQLRDVVGRARSGAGAPGEPRPGGGPWGGPGGGAGPTLPPPHAAGVRRGRVSTSATRLPQVGVSLKSQPL